VISKTSFIQAVTTSLKVNLTAVGLLSLLSCASGPIPKWDGDLWVGDSKRAAVVRKDALPDGTVHETVKPATDPSFDKGMWISYNDFRSFYATYVLGCRQWKKGIPMMTAQEALARFRPVIEDMEREAAEVELKNK
jgi:hypothetical protein